MTVENLTPVEAASVLLSTAFGEGYFNLGIEKKLHTKRPTWVKTSEAIDHWSNLFQDAQKSQLLVDTVNNVLDGQEAIRWPLTQRQARVLRLRYGLKDGQIRTRKAVGEEIEVTRERIRQIEAEALQSLRVPEVRYLWKSFLPGSH